jgi:hypothetical protein
MAITGFPITNSSASTNVGDLSQLPTTDKTNLVNALIELDNTKADQEDVGNVDNLNLLNTYTTSKI